MAKAKAKPATAQDYTHQQLAKIAGVVSDLSERVSDIEQFGETGGTPAEQWQAELFGGLVPDGVKNSDTTGEAVGKWVANAVKAYERELSGVVLPMSPVVQADTGPKVEQAEPGNDSGQGGAAG